MAGTEKQRKQFLSRKSQEGDLLSRKNFSLAYTYHDVTSIYASMYSTMGELQNNPSRKHMVYFEPEDRICVTV